MRSPSNSETNGKLVLRRWWCVGRGAERREERNAFGGSKAKATGRLDFVLFFRVLLVFAWTQCLPSGLVWLEPDRINTQRRVGGLALAKCALGEVGGGVFCCLTSICEVDRAVCVSLCVVHLATCGMNVSTRIWRGTSADIRAMLVIAGGLVVGLWWAIGPLLAPWCNSGEMPTGVELLMERWFRVMRATERRGRTLVWKPL